MRIEYHYIYVRVAGPTIYVPSPSGGGGLHLKKFKQQLAMLKQQLDAMTQTPEWMKDPGGRKQQVRNIIAEIIGKLAHVTGKGLQDAIMSGLDAAIAAVNSGDVNQGFEIASNMLKMTNDAVEIGSNLEGVINELKGIANALPEPAKSAMESIISDAEAAIDVATDPSELQGLLDLLNQAAEVGKRMLSMSPDSPGFADALNDLGVIDAEIGTHGMGGGNDPTGGAGGLGEDTLALLGGNPSDAIKDLLDQEPDHFGCQQLRQLDAKFKQILGLFDALPGDAARQAAADSLRQILALAGQGKYGEANAEADKLFARMDRLVKLMPVVQTKCDRATSIASRLRGPAKDALLKVIRGVQLQMAEATSPEELLHLDELMMRAMHAAERASAGGPNAARELLMLNSLARKVNGNAGTSPFGGDCYKGGKPAASPTGRLKGGECDWLELIEVDAYLKPATGPSKGPKAGGPPPSSDPPSDPYAPAAAQAPKPFDPFADQARLKAAKNSALAPSGPASGEVDLVVAVAIAVEPEPSPGA
ncbi:MAG TPA: hypothetical protein V6D47_08295 [Oscillatoriaceae cyanobacterium]